MTLNKSTPRIKDYYLVSGQSASIQIGPAEEVQIDAIFYGGLAERATFSKLFYEINATKNVIFQGATPGHSMTVQNNTITLAATAGDSILFKAMFL